MRVDELTDVRYAVEDGCAVVTIDRPERMNAFRGRTVDELISAFKHAWADPKSGMVFCLSEAPSAEAVQRIHERAGHPADDIYEVPVQA